MRHCEVCTASDLEVLHRQRFLLPGLPTSVHYDVMSCRRCGFCYASQIPSQQDLGRYYENTNKHLHATVLPSGLADAHRSFFDFIRKTLPELSQESNILDIGSSIGHFLNLFKSAGYKNLCGIEPSKTASSLARNTYGIEVTPSTLEAFQPNQQYGLVSLCGVLEHLSDLRQTLDHVANLVADDGFLFIAVPDASRFGDQPPREPFLEFAIEHINFFTGHDLDSLLNQAGFQTIEQSSVWNNFYANHYLLALYRKAASNHGDTSLQHNNAGRRSLLRYISHSNDAMEQVRTKIDQLVQTQEPLVVWGMGALTSRLLATTPLLETNLLTIIDRNPELHGCLVAGISVNPPESLKFHPNATVFISSYVYGGEIARQLREMPNRHGPIITL
jgi:SAM-dependent methyltransferase